MKKRKKRKKMEFNWELRKLDKNKKFLRKGKKEL